MFESMLESVNDPTMLEAAKKAGAKGINLVGDVLQGAEMMSRHGIPHAGNFMSTEAILVTGAVDAMAVDVQCIKQGLAKVADCYGTKLFTTNPRCHIEGVEHIEFEEHDPKKCTDEIVIRAITGSRTGPQPSRSRKLKILVFTGFPMNISTTCSAVPSVLPTGP